MANTERVKAVVEHTEKALAAQSKTNKVVNRLSFNMEDWYVETKNAAGEICGTAMCLAGWTAHYAGLKMFAHNTTDDDGGNYKEIVVDEPGTPEYKTVESWAAEYLELTPDEVEIFYYTDLENLEQLKAALNYVLEEDVFEGVPHYYDF